MGKKNQVRNKSGREKRRKKEEKEEEEGKEGKKRGKNHLYLGGGGIP